MPLILAMDAIKQKILDEAEALFMRYGLKSVSMDDIARKLAMSKKTLYQFVGGKHDLIKEVMQCNGERDIEVLQASALEADDAIDEYLRNSRYFIREMRNVSPTTLYDLKKYYPDIWNNQFDSQKDHFLQGIYQNIIRGQAEGLYRNEINPDIIARIYAQTVLAIADTSLFPAVDISLDKIIHQHAVYHLHGIMTHDGRKKLKEHLDKEELE